MAEATKHTAVIKCHIPRTFPPTPDQHVTCISVFYSSFLELRHK